MQFDRRWPAGLLVVFLAVSGFAFSLHASYPGYLNADSLFQLKQALEWSFDDWHSPFVVLLWSLLLKLLPGPVGYIVLTNLLVWASLAGLALALRKQFGVASILIVAVPLLPGAFNFLGNVHVDVLLVAWLLAAFSAAYLSRRHTVAPRTRLALQVLANLFAFAAFFTRLNAIFCLVPLLLYANARIDWRRNIVLVVLLLAAMPLLYKVQNTVLEVQAQAPSDSIKVYNLLALSYYEHRNLLPGQWSDEQSREIVNACYSPVQWDTAWSGSCDFIHQNLVRQGIWGSALLTRTWLREIIMHPAGYFTLLTATFKRSMFEPNSRAMLYHTPNPWNWEVAVNPPRPSTELAQKYIRSEFNDQVGRPWVYALLSALGVVLLFRLRLMSGEIGQLALALHLSGLVYLLTFFVFNVSAEYRYFYWCGFAAYLGLILTLLAGGGGRGAASRPVAADPKLRLPALGIAALALALVLFPYHHPTERRVITLTPLDDAPVVTAGVHHASTPKWMRANFEGRVDPMAWRPEPGLFHSTRRNSPLVVELDSLKQDIEVVLLTGPAMGRVAIESNGFYRQLDAEADQAGYTTVRLPPLNHEVYSWLSASLSNALSAFFTFLAMLFAVALFSTSSKDKMLAGFPGGKYVVAASQNFQNWIVKCLQQRIVRFAVVGGVGFLIEAALLSYFANVPGIGVIKGRAISFPVAVAVTWWLNRRLTFRSQNPPGRESLRYFVVQSIGAFANLGVFLTLVTLFPYLQALPVLSLFIAAIFGLALNFVLSRKFVFIKHE